MDPLPEEATEEEVRGHCCFAGYAANDELGETWAREDPCSAHVEKMVDLDVDGLALDWHFDHESPSTLWLAWLGGAAAI